MKQIADMQQAGYEFTPEDEDAVGFCLAESLLYGGAGAVAGAVLGMAVTKRVPALRPGGSWSRWRWPLLLANTALGMQFGSVMMDESECLKGLMMVDSPLGGMTRDAYRQKMPDVWQGLPEGLKEKGFAEYDWKPIEPRRLMYHPSAPQRMD